MRASDFAYCATPFAAMAHRGGGLWEPNLGKENTLAAFRQAVSIGYRYLETDLQATADGRLVCMHDDTLERTAGAPGRVRDYTAAELSQFTVDGEPIPFFDEVVEALPGARFNVDLKTEEAVRPLAAAIEELNLTDRILVDSFSQRRISRFRALTRGRVPTAMAQPGVVWTRFVPGLSTVLSSPAVAVQVPLTHSFGAVTVPVVTEQLIARVHRLGKVIHVWTINDQPDMERLIDLGVDGIITDRPDLLKNVLVGRNLWESK